MKSRAVHPKKTSVTKRSTAIKEPAKARGQMKAFTRAEVVLIDELLLRRGSRRAVRDRALFAVAVDTMLRGSDMIRIRVGNVKPSARAEVVGDFVLRQKKTDERICCNLTRATQIKLEYWLAAGWEARPYCADDYVFAICDRQYRTIIKNLAEMIGLDPARYSGHSTRRTMSTRIYNQTKNLGAVRVLLGHASLGSTAAYLGIEQADATAVWEQVTSGDQ